MSGYPLDEFEKRLASYYKDKKCVSYVAWDRQKNVISEEVRAFVDKMDALDFKNEIKHWNSVDADDVEYKFIGMIDFEGVNNYDSVFATWLALHQGYKLPTTQVN
jgi:hypothetical protein